MAEIFRAGIESISKGQLEAAASLGLSRAKVARLIVLPQALRVVIPPLGNEMIAMIKDTSLLSILSVRDITQRMREFQASSFLPFAPFNTAAISLRYDKKQALLDKPNTPKKANVIGAGKLLTDGYAHGTVLLDLSASSISTGTKVGGAASTSSRPAIMVDSCRDLWLVSSVETTISAGNGGNKSIHVEHQGAGAIHDVNGNRIGTRAIGDFKTSGNFADFGPMHRAGQPFNADAYLQAR